MTDRRSLLRGLAALPVLAAASTAASASASDEPIIRLHDEWLRIHAHYCRTDISDEEAESGLDRSFEIEEEVIRRRATTTSGAIRSIEWAMAEYREYHYDNLLGHDLILALLDGALGMLCRQGT